MAQPFPPRIGYVCPAGGQRGSTFEVTVGGQYLDNVASARFTGSGVKATILEHVKPITQKEFNDLRGKLQELQKQPAGDEAAKEIAEIRKKIASFVRRPSSPAIAETVTIQVTLASDAALGRHEVRLAAPNGGSNPLAFEVGPLPEFTKKLPKDLAGLRDLQALRQGSPPRGNAYAPPTNVTIPTIVNGQVLPGGVDRYRFTAVKGLHLVVATEARELMPYIPDAVPGWFQAAVTLYDADGREVAFADHFRYHVDPVLYYEVPKDGQYVLEVRDSLYRGREDFVYRITIGEVPLVTGIFPLGGKAGEATLVDLTGWNLPTKQLTQDGKDKGPGVYPLSAQQGEWLSHRVPLFVMDTLPEVLAKKDNHSRKSAQALTLPVIVNGRVEQPGQWEVFRFEGRAGGEIAAEVSARRLGNPLDSVLRLTDAGGRQLAYSDDREDKGLGLDTHHADSYLCAKLPADGAYFLHLGDVQQQGGPEYAYRLRISAPRPDFELRITPSSVNVRGGGSVPLTVYALRKDGFAGEIQLALKDAPANFTLSGACVPANQDQVRLTLTAPPNPLKEPGALCLEGRAKTAGKEVARKAVPAEDMMQAFAYRHLVPAQEMGVFMPARGGGRGAIRILIATPVKIPVGRTAKVLIGAPQNTPFGNLQLELSDPPEGISLKGVTPIGQGSEMVLQCDAAKVKPGLKGNLIVNVFLAAKNPSTAPARPAMNPRRMSLGMAPAIPFEIVEP